MAYDADSLQVLFARGVDCCLGRQRIGHLAGRVQKQVVAAANVFEPWPCVRALRQQHAPKDIPRVKAAVSGHFNFAREAASARAWKVGVRGGAVAQEDELALLYVEASLINAAAFNGLTAAKPLPGITSRKHRCAELAGMEHSVNMLPASSLVTPSAFTSSTCTPTSVPSGRIAPSEPTSPPIIAGPPNSVIP